ncbi:hypothetical protein ACFQ23_07800, partial [Schaalia naturae]
RAATASVVEPPAEAAPAGVQETTSGSAQAHRVTSLEEIALPDSHAEEPRAPQTRRRHRRAVSSGVVDTDQG